MSLDLKGALFYTPEQIAVMFGKSTRWVYRHAAAPGTKEAATHNLEAKPGFLVPAARRFGKTLLFLRSEIDRLIQEGAPGAPE